MTAEVPQSTSRPNFDPERTFSPLEQLGSIDMFLQAASSGSKAEIQDSYLNLVEEATALKTAPELVVDTVDFDDLSADEQKEVRVDTMLTVLDVIGTWKQSLLLNHLSAPTAARAVTEMKSLIDALGYDGAEKIANKLTAIVTAQMEGVDGADKLGYLAFPRAHTMLRIADKSRVLNQDQVTQIAQPIIERYHSSRIGQSYVRLRDAEATNSFSGIYSDRVKRAHSAYKEAVRLSKPKLDKVGPSVVRRLFGKKPK